MQPDDTAHESEMLTVASLFREAVQVTPPSDEVVSMVALPDELLQHIFKQACNDACNVLDPRAAVALSRASHGIRAAAQALLPQLKAYHQAAAALCLKLRERRGSTDRALRSCKELREAKHRSTGSAEASPRPTWCCCASWSRCCQRSRSCGSSKQPAPKARSSWWRGWTRARCRS